MAAVPSLAGIVANHFAAVVVVVAPHFAVAAVVVAAVPRIAEVAVGASHFAVGAFDFAGPRLVAVAAVANHFVGLEKVVGPSPAVVGVITAWR